MLDVQKGITQKVADITYQIDGMDKEVNDLKRRLVMLLQSFNLYTSSSLTSSQLTQRTYTSNSDNIFSDSSLGGVNNNATTTNTNTFSMYTRPNIPLTPDDSVLDEQQDMFLSFVQSDNNTPQRFI